MIEENVCNMPELATIKIHKYEGKYYLNFIAYEEVADKLDIPNGMWIDSESIPNSLINKILTEIKKTDYVKGEQENTTIKGIPWPDVYRIKGNADD